MQDWRKCDVFSVGFIIITMNENAIWMVWLVARYQISNMSFWTLISDSLGVQVLIYLLSWIITKKWHFESVKKYWYLNVYTKPRSYSMKLWFKIMDLIFCNLLRFKSSKNMDLIFCKLKRPQKYGFNFLQLWKSSKSMDFIFCKLKKAQRSWI